MLTFRELDGGRPGDGEWPVVPALPAAQLPGLRVQGGAPGPHRHADYVHPPPTAPIHHGTAHLPCQSL